MRSPLKKKHFATEGGKMVFLTDSAYAAQAERNRLRKVRLLQVRKLSNDAAKLVRQRVKDEQERKISQIAKEELQKYIRTKTNELEILESEYQSALSALGQGYKGLQEEENYKRWLQEQRVLQEQIADIRGDHALKVVNFQKVLDNKLKENKIALKTSVSIAEKLRAAEIRTKPHAKRFNKVEIIEINPTAKDVKKVKFVDRNQVVDSNVQGIVERLRSTADVGQGLECAIEELENVKPSDTFKYPYESPSPRKSLRSRTSSKLSRSEVDSSPSASKKGLKVVRKPEGTDSSEDSFADIRRRFETLLNRGRPVKQPEQVEDFEKKPLSAILSQESQYPDIDLTPVRGPSSTDASGISTPSSLHATVSRQFEKMEEKVDENKVHGLPTTISKTDENFIRKVLEGVDLDSNLVDVKVQVKECSTLSVSSESHTSSSEASINQKNEKFLLQNWGKDLTDYAPIHGLIEKLKISTREKDHQDLLRYYIEKLLKMKRQEIAELSVTSTDQSLSSASAAESTKESSMRSSMSLAKSSISLSNSSGDQDTYKGFASSTPASTLSSSGSRSSNSKTVRFQLDNPDGTFQTRHESDVELKKEEICNRTRESLEEITRQYEEQRQAIEKELLRRKLEKQKDFSKDSSQSLSISSSSKSKKSPSPSELVLSEGPLSSSSSSHEKSNSFTTSGKEVISGTIGPFQDSESDTQQDLLSKAQSEREAKILMQKQIRKQQLEAFTKLGAESEGHVATLINKSSSSGTSGSTATAEFLARLREMELPSLRRPTPDQLQALQQSSGQNTSSDVAKLQDLESSSSHN